MATVNKAIIERPRDYSNAKVYKIQPICGGEEGEIYIGSTTKKYLSQRMVAHKSDYFKWKSDKGNKITVFDIFDKYGFNGCEITLIENVECISKDELLQKERHHIQINKCINKNIPLRTKAEYYIDTLCQRQLYYRENADTILQRVKQYRNNNLIKIKEKNKEYYKNNLNKIKEHRTHYYKENADKIINRSKEYYENNTEKVKQRNKTYNEENAEKIKERYSQSYICSCGSSYTHCHKIRHEKTKKHLTYIAEISVK